MKTILKLEMAKVIVCALYNMDKLPKDDHHHVKILMRRTKNELNWAWVKAQKLIKSKHGKPYYDL